MGTPQFLGSHVIDRHVFADINGVRLHYEDEGAGEPVLLIGGFGANARFWRDAVSRLGGYRVVTLDNRGVGETEYSGGFTIDDMADDAVMLMEHLGIRRFHALGWSMGSHIGQSMGIRYPYRLKSLTLVSTYLRRPARSEYILGNLTSMALNGEAPVSCLAIAVNAFCFPESTFRELELRGESMPVPRRLEDPRGLMDQLAAVGGYDTTDLACRISVPTLVVHGTEDVMVEPCMGEAVADAIEGSELLLVDGAGHNIPFGMYADRFREFVDLHSDA